MTVAVEPSTRRAAAFHPLTVAAVDRLTEDAVAVTFDVPAELADAFSFAPGQFLTVRRTVAGREHRRSYSICAPVGSRPRIGVRRIPDGSFSAWLVDEVRVGDVIEVQPPSGNFRADPSTPARHLCIAAGSGITPVLSIAASVLAEPEAEVALLYGNRTSASVMFAEEIADLKNACPERFQLVHVLSREPRDVELFSGRLDADRLRRMLSVVTPVMRFDHVWVCGPHELVEEARGVLAELGFPAERVHVELFYVDAPPPPVVRRADVPAGATCELTVILDGSGVTVPVRYDTTVLEGAQRARADLPFACKGGVCGTCRARVREGEVDMRRNYALEDAEVEAGFVLTCQSYPVSAAAVVDYDA